jgi:hypothetical protein
MKNNESSDVDDDDLVSEVHDLLFREKIIREERKKLRNQRIIS